MPDQMTPEQLQELAEAIEKLKAQKEAEIITNEEYLAGLQNLTGGMKGFNKGVAAAALAIEGLGKTAWAVGGAMLDGKQGYSAYNDGLKEGANALDSILTLFGPLGSLLGKLIKTWASYEAKVNEAKDKLYDTNQQLAKSGIADGVTTVATNLRSFGYGLEELGKMTRLLQDNSRTLAEFGGTASMGAKRFADVAKGIKDSDLQRQFMNMGMGVDEINTGIAAYMRQQTMLGISQTKTTNELRSGSADYLKNMAMLSKLTGESAEALAKQQEEAMGIGAFYAKLEDLPEAEKKNLLDRYNFMAKYDKEGATAMAKTVAGIGLGTEEQQRMIQKYGTNFLSTVTDASLPLETFASNMHAGSVAMKDFNKSQAYLGQNDDYVNQARFRAAGGLDAFTKQIGDAKAETAAQMRGEDAAQAEAVKTRQTQMQMRDKLQDTIINGLNPFTKALGGATEAVNKWTGKPSGSSTSSPTTTTAPGATTSTTSGKTPSQTVEIKNAQGEVVETRQGGNLNWRNNNPGNIEYGEFAKKMGAIGANGRFAVFPSMEMGEKAQDALLKGKSYSNLTAADAIKKWAPPSENDTKSYIENISKQTGLDMTKRYADMSADEQKKFRSAMNKIEGGKEGTVVAGKSAPTSGYQKTDIAGVQSNVPDAKENEATKMSDAIDKNFESFMAEQRKLNAEMVAQQRQSNQLLATQNKLTANG